MNFNIYSNKFIKIGNFEVKEWGIKEWRVDQVGLKGGQVGQWIYGPLNDNDQNWVEYFANKYFFIHFLDILIYKW